MAYNVPYTLLTVDVFGSAPVSGRDLDSLGTIPTLLRSYHIATENLITRLVGYRALREY